MPKDTSPKARRGMTTFVIVIFIIAVLLAAVYLLGFTPGETTS
ncbi:hypothetical protein [Oryzifoliimicrobium ureilyticus]